VDNRYYPVTSIISDWFDRRLGLALGLSAAGSSIGGIFWPIVVDKLHQEFGMKRAFQGVGLIALIPLVISAFLVKERPGRGKITLRDLLRLRSCSELPGFAGGKGGGVGARGIMKGLKTVAQPRFLALSAALFFVYGGFLVPFNYIPQFAEYNGHKSMGNILLAICYSGSAVGRVGTGALADRLGT
jgi:nitrate/nitrite transporter NarK